MNKRYVSGYFTFYQNVDGTFEVSFWRHKPNADCGKAFSARIEIPQELWGADPVEVVIEG